MCRVKVTASTFTNVNTSVHRKMATVPICPSSISPAPGNTFCQAGPHSHDQAWMQRRRGRRKGLDMLTGEAPYVRNSHCSSGHRPFLSSGTLRGLHDPARQDTTSCSCTSSTDGLFASTASQKGLVRAAGWTGRVSQQSHGWAGPVTVSHHLLHRRHMHTHTHTLVSYHHVIKKEMTPVDTAGEGGRCGGGGGR